MGFELDEELLTEGAALKDVSKSAGKAIEALDFTCFRLISLDFIRFHPISFGFKQFPGVFHAFSMHAQCLCKLFRVRLRRRGFGDQGLLRRLRAQRLMVPESPERALWTLPAQCCLVQGAEVHGSTSSDSYYLIYETKY